jgi:adenylate cyclase
LATYGHPGRTADIAGSKEKLKRLLIERGDNREFSGLFVRNYFPFKNYADTERLLEGLRKADVADLPFGLDPKSEDRLGGNEIKALLFGHEVQGRRPDTDEPYLRTTSVDGESAFSVGAYSDLGVSWIEGNSICVWANARGRYCAAIFRNPAGNLGGRNEYFWINVGNRLEFSVVQ